MSLRKILARGRSAALLAPALLLALLASPSRADFILSVQSVTVDAGSAGNALDVTLTNTGPAAATFGGFSFGLTASPGLTFTSVTTATTAAPYLFGGLGLFGPDITVTPPPAGSAILASDLYSVIGSGTTVAAGATFGLGHVFFNVGAAATGSITVALAAFPTTSLSNSAGGNVAITTLNPGTVRIASSGVIPEPSSALLCGMACVTGLLVTRARRRSE